MRLLKIISLAAGLLFAANAQAADAPITFNNQVIRIFQQQCQTCHRPGNIAPFSLLTYTDALSRATSIKQKVQTRAMPPWKPIDPHGKFEEERRLTNQEIDTIVRWIDEGLLEGSPSDLPEPIKFPATWTYNTPDVVVQPSAPYPLDPAGGDIYRCFSMPVNSTTDLNVRGYEVLPGNREIVHHVLLFIDTTGTSANLDALDPAPGYTCFGGPGFIPDSALGGWAPGMSPEIFPLGLGVTVPANSRIVMQVHYSPLGHVSHQHLFPTGPPAPDTTRLGMFLSPAKLRQVEYWPVVNFFFSIPPGNSRYQVTAVTSIPREVELTAVTPHMHLLGREVRVEARFPNGTIRELVHITDWDFSWQATYTFKEPILLPAGTIVTSTAWYDNSVNNPRNPSNPPKSVGWGEKTTDEMCLTFLSVTAPGARSMTEIPFTMADRGGVAINGTGEGSTLSLGYARLTPQPGSPSGEGLAILGFRQNNVLVTETTVAASPAALNGRIFAEINGPVNSGVAIANPSSEDSTVSFYFTDSSGARVKEGTRVVAANSQIAMFLNEAPFEGPPGFVGSFTFTATKPVSVIALRNTVNERGESLLTTLPVAALNSVSPRLVFPHFANGDGWKTEILLVNPTDAEISGTYVFLDDKGTPGGDPVSYSVAPRSAVRYFAAGAVVSGSVSFAPGAGMPAPAGSLVFSYDRNGVRVAEAGVPAVAEATAFRMYVETSENGSVQSGVAIANTSSAPATVALELTNLSGSSVARTIITLPPNGQLARFLGEIPGFESLRLPFQGVLRVSSSSTLAAIGLRGRYNERSDFLVTTIPPAGEASALQTGDKFFAHFVNGGGYTTQFIVFSSSSTGSGGALLFYSNSGQPSGLTVR